MASNQLGGQTITLSHLAPFVDLCHDDVENNWCMDGGIVSFKVGMTKPDPRMFKHFLEKYALQPESCVFIDDTYENVEAAQLQGMKGIEFHSYDELLSELNKLGITI